MGTYRQPGIIDEAAGLKQANAEVSKFNDELDSLFGPQATEEDGEDSKSSTSLNDIRSQNEEILNKLEINRINQDQKESAALFEKEKPNAFLEKLGFDLKDKFYDHAVNNRTNSMQQMLKLPGNLVGTMAGFNQLQDQVNNSLDNPRGGAGAVNTSLIDPNMFRLASNLITDPSYKNMKVDINDDGTDVNIGVGGYAKMSTNMFTANLMKKDTKPLVSINGNMQDVTTNMLNSGEGKQNFIETTLNQENIKPNEKGVISSEEGNKVLSKIAEYDQEKILNNQDYVQSIYPQVLDQTLAIYKEVKDKNNNELDPIQSQIKNTWENNPYGMKDPVNDYNKNGSTIIGNYVGAQVATNRENSPDVIFDRKIVQLGLNESYAREFARPIIDVKQEVQAEEYDIKTDTTGKKSAFERKTDLETGEITRTFVGLTDETGDLYNQVNKIGE